VVGLHACLVFPRFVDDCRGPGMAHVARTGELCTFPHVPAPMASHPPACSSYPIHHRVGIAGMSGGGEGEGDEEDSDNEEELPDLQK